MNPQPTPKQRRDFENALKIGEVLASTVGTVDSPRIRVNPHTLKEAVGIYNTLGAKKPLLLGSEQFVMNCLLYSAETFAACSHRVVLCHHLIGRDVVYWYGNGIVKEREPLNNLRFFVGDNSFLIASMLMNKAIYVRLQPFLTPHVMGSGRQIETPVRPYPEQLNMGLPAQTEIECPHCGNNVAITYWRTVNATLHPALRKRVLNGSLRRHHCPTCNEGFVVKTPLLYHDVNRRFMLWLAFEVPGQPPPTWKTELLETSAAALKEYQFRLVSEWDELVEKINMFENGWDDRIVETLKLLVIEKVFPFGSQDFKESTARLTRLADDGSLMGAFYFEIRKDDTVVGDGTAPLDLYDKLVAGQEERFGKNYGAGEWTMVNKATILDKA